MQAPLKNTRIAILATDGFEQSELERPLAAIRDAGGVPVVVSLDGGTIRGTSDDPIEVDLTVGEARAEDFAGLVLPGGLKNPDTLRMDKASVGLIRAFAEKERPIAAICHAPWLLIEAGLVSGRTLTSWPSLATDIENAGGTWVDEEVRVDGNLITSRNPDDLDAFCERFVEAMAGVGSAG